MSEFSKTSRNTLKRVSNRGSYDRETIYQILDDGYVCHVGIADGEQPLVIPMAYGRAGDTLYLHGSSKSRLQHILSDGTECCITVTHLDGLVISRSAFDTSMNYRSVMIFGKARPVEGLDQKKSALRAVAEHLVPGRWDEIRKPTDKEIKATGVAAVGIDEASAKVRTGPPKDNRKHLDLPVWAGVIPFTTVAGEPEPDPELKEGIDPEPSVRNFEI